METFNRYVSVAVVIITVFGLPLTLSRWREAWHCYGLATFRLARNLWTYATCSGHRIPLLGGVALHVLTILGEVRWYVKGEPYPRWLHLSGLLFSWRLIADRICPPTALLLSASSLRSVERKAWLSRSLPQHRVISFLVAREHVPSFLFLSFFKDDLRIRRGNGWRTPVSHLADVAPWVIVDARDVSPIVEEEVRRLVDDGLGSKVLVFGDDEAAPLKKLYVGSGAHPRSVADRDLARILAGGELGVQSRDERRQLQAEYTALFQEIPPAARPDLNLRGAQVVAQLILDREYRRFVRTFKGLELSELGDRLVEELPAKVSRAKEDEYLRLNRPLQIAGGIYQCMREEVANEQGVWAIFHGASLDTKLGKLARFRRSWEPALASLHAAQQVLRRMFEDGPGPVDRRILATELGNAFFLEGEVWAVQFLDAPTAEKRAKGLRCFEEARRVDEFLGEEDPRVRSRLRLLSET